MVVVYMVQIGKVVVGYPAITAAQAAGPLWIGIDSVAKERLAKAITEAEALWSIKSLGVKTVVVIITGRQAAAAALALHQAIRPILMAHGVKAW